MKIIKVQVLDDIPDYFTGVAEWPDGTKRWFKDGKYHREDGPAVEYADGSKDWYKNGNLHREDGPAVEYPGGKKYWFLKDKQYCQINLNDNIVLDHYKGEYTIMWYKLLDKDKVFDYPDIPGLIKK
jgi:hypothetical protein